jgi:FkbM family methyltransferase
MDIGANEGQSVADILSVVGRDAKIVAVEPNPGVAAYLQEVCEINGFENVRVLPIGLSNRAHIARLDLASIADTGGSIVEKLRPGRQIERTRSVPCFALDELVLQKEITLRTHFLMKIDVEGAELEVLEGARSVIEKYRPTILCEILWAHCPERLPFIDKRNNKILAILGDSNYDVYAIKLDSTDWTLSGIQRIRTFPSAVYSSSNAHQCDYLFLPEELSSSVPPALLTRNPP